MKNRNNIFRHKPKDSSVMMSPSNNRANQNSDPTQSIIKNLGGETWTLVMKKFVQIILMSPNPKNGLKKAREFLDEKAQAFLFKALAPFEGQIESLKNHINHQTTKAKALVEARDKEPTTVKNIIYRVKIDQTKSPMANVLIYTFLILTILGVSAGVITIFSVIELMPSFYNKHFIFQLSASTIWLLFGCAVLATSQLVESAKAKKMIDSTMIWIFIIGALCFAISFVLMHAEIGVDEGWDIFIEALFFLSLVVMEAGATSLFIHAAVKLIKNNSKVEEIEKVTENPNRINLDNSVSKILDIIQKLETQRKKLMFQKEAIIREAQATVEEHMARLEAEVYRLSNTPQESY